MEGYNRIVKTLLENHITCRAVIVSGLHGDEPAGNEASKCFKGLKGITVIRNINKTGKRRDGRVDLNRQFNTNNRKTKRILEIIQSRMPKIVISLHEDFDGKGVYVYCSTDIKNKLETILPKLNVKLVDSAYGDKASNGVISDTEDPYHGTLEEQLSKMNISYCTVETPTKWSYEKRANIHRQVVSALIEKAN